MFYGHANKAQVLLLLLLRDAERVKYTSMKYWPKKDA